MTVADATAVTGSTRISVVVPMHRTARYLSALISRIEAATPRDTELVLVDDACPEKSWQRASELSTPSRVKVVRISPNVGQHAAVLAGLGHTSGDVVVVMDADLQDPPEAVMMLVTALLSDPTVDVVSAARAGRYTGLGRRTSAATYRAAARFLSNGRIPAGAGMFLAMRQHAVHGVLALDDPYAPLVPALARSGARIHALKITRAAREGGESGHGSLARLRIAARGLVTLTPAHGLLAKVGRRKWAQVAPHIRLVNRPVSMAAATEEHR